MPKTTEKQRKARRRNYCKFRLMGIKTSLVQMVHCDVITEYERDKIRQAIKDAKNILRNWDEHNEEVL